MSARNVGVGNAAFLGIGIALGLTMSAILQSRPGSWRRSAQAKGESHRPRVVCFGDSLTQYGLDPEKLGWMAHLAHWWQRRFDVVNRGFGGYNTRWGIPMLDKLFVPGGAARTLLVTIFFGANDAVVSASLQHVPLDEYKENLREMVHHIQKAHPGVRIVIMAPPPIHEGMWADHRGEQGRPMDRKQHLTRAYAAASLEVAAELNIPSVDTYNILGGGEEAAAARYLHDGVHLNDRGNQAVFRALRATLLHEFPDLEPERVPMQAPWSGDVDPSNFAGCILRAM